MSVHTFAAIYIGSYEVSLKIFEISSTKKIKNVDYVRSHIELGRDTYTKGSIGYELVDALCDTLAEYKRIMNGYRVDGYEAYAGTALRDVRNELFILDQIKIRTGIEVHVLSNSEHRFISYKSVAVRDEFEEMIQKGAAVVDAGGGGMQITVFSKGKVIGTQHLALGTMRMREQLANTSVNLSQYEHQIEELAEKELEVYKSMYLQNAKIKYIIFVGDYITEIVRKLENEHEKNTISIQKFLKYLDKLKKKNLEEIADELGMVNESDELIVPYIILFYCIAKKSEAESVWAPGVSVSDGIAYDYAERNNKIQLKHDFEEDVLSAARNMAARYNSFTPHIEALTQMSGLLFDTMKKVHGLGKREKLLLKISAILHDCGKYISFSNGPMCSYDIIMASEIIGLTHLEREIIANTVLYNSWMLPEYEELKDKLDRESYIIVAKLSAILRVSNAMDRSHKQKFKNVKAVLKGKELIITLETLDDVALEKTLFSAKAAYFESIFSIKPVIKVKRVYQL